MAYRQLTASPEIHFYQGTKIAAHHAKSSMDKRVKYFSNSPHSIEYVEETENV
jgi:hypothetical protein